MFSIRFSTIDYAHNKDIKELVMLILKKGYTDE